MRSKRMPVLAALLLAQTLVPQLFAQNSLTSKAKQPRYRLEDLGTFGGQASLVFGGTGDLNQSDTLVTSCAETGTLDPDWPNINPWLASGPYLSPYVQHAFRWSRGMLTDLGTLPGGTSSCGAGVNTRGVVVGLSTDGSLDPLTGFPAIHAVRWRDGKIQDLGTLGGNESYASFINDRGQITGAALNAIPDSFTTQLFIGATQVHAFLWDNDSMHDLGTLGGANSIGWYINQRGEIAGQSFKDDIPNETTGIPTIGSFLWRNGKMVDLGSLGGTWGTPNALNNVGQVVGTSDLEGDEIFHPFLWERGSITDLGTLGGSTGQAFWINERGAVVGKADLPGDERWDAFLWQRGAMTDLGNLGCTSTAYSINEQGQIVGTSRLADCQTVHAILWENGRIYDLNDLIPPGSGLELYETHAINDQGVIAGNALPPGCDDVHVCGHAFLLFPCDSNDLRKCVNRSQVTTAATNLSASPVPTPSATVKNLQSDGIRASRDPLMQRRGFYQRGSRVD